MKETMYSYKIYALLFALLLGLVSAITVGAAQQGEDMARIQRGIAGEVLRFHVLANSDETQDQELKLQVKTEVVAYLEQILGADADLKETKKQIAEHLQDIAGIAQKTIMNNNREYPVTVSLTESYFPEKQYGDCTLPAGKYETLQVRIGKAQGENWWCVLYPSLCFVKESLAVVTQEKMQEMKQILTVEEYDRITRDARIKIRLKWFSRLLGT